MANFLRFSSSIQISKTSPAIYNGDFPTSRRPDEIGIMRPNREAPHSAPYEVGMILRHAEVVNSGNLAAVRHRFNRAPPPVVAAQQVPRLQLGARQPALAPDVERVLRRRAEHLPAHM